MPRLPFRRNASQTPVSPPRPSILSPYADPNRPTPKLPYASHPLYHLRLAVIVVDIIGIILVTLAGIAELGSPYSYRDAVPLAIWSAAILCASALLSYWDLRAYASKQLRDPERKPAWPSRPIMWADLALAVVMIWSFFGVVGEVAWAYRPNLVLAYGVLAELVGGLGHAWAFKKQLVASYERSFLAKLERSRACARCGFEEDLSVSSPFRDEAVEAPAADTTSGRTQANPNLQSYVGPDASVPSSSTPTPATTDHAMEEGLIDAVSGEASSSNQAVFDPEEHILDQPEDVIVKKGKMRKSSSRTSLAAE
ncbi:hypothetical protein LTR95_007220 [Oleoguttula sp. CCFEE 5521]